TAGAAGGGAGGRGGGSGAGGAAATVAWDWAGIVGTGQSLSVGAEGTPVLPTTPRYQNPKLSLGRAAGAYPLDPPNAAPALAPPVEPIRAVATSYPSAYPVNLYGETPHTAMGDEITVLVMGATGRGYMTVHTVVGESGQPMSVIRKGATDTG